MSYCNCEWEDVYIKERIISPHCDTCQCRRSELEVRSKIRRPLSNIPRSISVRSSRPCLADVIHCCSCNCIRDCDLCLCYECRKILGRSEASIHRRESRLRFPEHKCSLLQSWFTKFDADGDGFLDLMDLEALLKYLGAKIQNSYIKRVLNKCDKDCDGRLSFPEFVHLWMNAALYDEDFRRNIGCNDLSHIIKKYKLYPETRHCNCHEYHCKHATPATRYPVHHIKCNCGQKGKVRLFRKYEPKPFESKKLEGESLKSEEKAPISEDKLPMSFNRDNIV